MLRLDHRAVTALFTFIFCFQSSAVLAQGINLDLSSTARGVAPPASLGDQSVSIQVGGTSRPISSLSSLTAAERIAAWQVISTGTQSIQLSGLGNAIGGQFSLGNWVNQRISDLVIPAGVKSVSSGGNMTFSGNLSNSGVIIVAPSSQVLSTITAANIFNNVGGAILSTAPLHLVAVNNLVNSGQIKSTASLTITAGNSIVNALPAGTTGPAPEISAVENVSLITNNITNSGFIASMVGNINLASTAAANLRVDNRQGVLSAVHGAINVRDAAFSGKHNFSVSGGDLLSKSVDIFSGDGIASLSVKNITGVLNIHAGAANVLADTPDLNLGIMDLTGDPSYFNTGGNVNIGSSIDTQGNALAIVASGDVTVSNGVSIATGDATTPGAPLLIMSGANVSSSPTSSGQVSNDISSTLFITGPSQTGGQINLTGLSGALSSSSTQTNLNGGNITLVAFGGTNTNSGNITVPSGINSAGNGNGINGNVFVLSGAETDPSGGTAINIGDITTYASGGSFGNGGEVVLATTANASISGNLRIFQGNPNFVPNISALNPSPPAPGDGVTFNISDTAGYAPGQSAIIGGGTTSMPNNAPPPDFFGTLEQAIITSVVPNQSITFESVTNQFVAFSTPNQEIPITLSAVSTISGALTRPASITTGNITTNGAPVLLAAGANVTVGSITTGGSPSTGTTQPGGNLLIFAGNNITGSGAIDTHGTSAGAMPAWGGDVIMVAGAALAGDVNQTFKQSGYAIDANVTVSGASAAGGNISLTNLTAFNTKGGSGLAQSQGTPGGNVTLVAFAGTSSGSGTGSVTVSGAAASFAITTGGTDDGSGQSSTPNSNGNVTVLAGATGSNAISVGNIDTTGSNAGAGDIIIKTAAATAGLPYSYGINNQFSGNSAQGAPGPYILLTGDLLPGAIINGASASVGNLTAAGGSKNLAPTGTGFTQTATTTISVVAGANLTAGSVVNSNNSLPANGAELSSSYIELIAGGVISFNANAISIQSNATANSTSGVVGGTILLNAASFNLVFNSNPVIVTVTADGINGFNATTLSGGDGGSITISTTGNTATSSVNIGNTPMVPSGQGYFTVSGMGDAGGGNGGYLSVTSGGSINIDPTSMTLNPQQNSLPAICPTCTFADVGNGNGATIVLNAVNASTTPCTTGCVFFSGTLNVDGAPSTLATGSGSPGGSGGYLDITVNSSAGFNVGNATTNGVAASGILTANGNVVSTGTAAFGSGGTISIANLGAGGIQIQANGSNTNVPAATGGLEVQSANAYADNANSMYFAAGDGGTIILKATAATGKVFSAGSLDASGGAVSDYQPGGSGGRIEIYTNSNTSFTVGSAATTNGIQSTLTALGNIGNNGTWSPVGNTGNTVMSNSGSGGSIILGNGGAGGITIGASSGVPNILVTAGDGNATVQNSGGDGGTIKLTAPAGLVTVAAALDVSGGLGAVFTQSVATANQPAPGSDVVIPLTSTLGFFAGQTVQLQGVLATNQAGTPVAPYNLIAEQDTITLTGVTPSSLTLATVANDFSNQTLMSNVSITSYYPQGNGGNIAITSGNSSAFRIGATTAPTNGVVGGLTANGYNGGVISVTNLVGGITVESGQNALTASPLPPSTSIPFPSIPAAPFVFGGSGGSLVLSAPFDPVIVKQSLNVNGLSGVASGGTGDSASDPLYGAQGAGTGGNGGSISITSGASGASGIFQIGATSVPTNGVFGSLTANGGAGALNGAGGSITVINLLGGISVASGSLTVTALSAQEGTNITSQPGDGGDISLQGLGGAVTINGSLNVDGGVDSTNSYAPGRAGSISITSKSSSFSVAAGQLSATGWNGGRISITNLGGGITVDNSDSGNLGINVAAWNAVPAELSALNQDRTAGGPGGSISLQALKGAVLISGNLDASGGMGCCEFGPVSGTAPTVPSPPLGQAQITGLSDTTNLFLGQFVAISGTVNGVPQTEIEQINTAVQSDNITVKELYTDFDNGEVTVTAFSPAGDGGQITILSSSSSRFMIGNATGSNGTTGTLTANGGGVAGGSGGNGGSITVINTGSGGITLSDPSNLTVDAAASTSYAPGGKGGSIYLSATGTGGKVYIGGDLHADGGVETEGSGMPGGAGGVIAITVNSSTVLFNLGNAASGCTTNCNGIAGVLSAIGSSGGSIGVKNLAAAGISFNPTSILVTASGADIGNGGNISLEATARNGILQNSAAGTLTADAYNQATGASSGGTIILNAYTINTNAGELVLSARGSDDGTDSVGGSVYATQLKTTTPLSVGIGSTLHFDVDSTGSGGIGGNISVAAPGGIRVLGKLNSCQACSSESGTIDLSVSGKGTITGTNPVIGADSLRLTTGTGIVGSLNTHVANLTIRSGGGNVTLVNLGAMTIHNSYQTGAGAINVTAEDITVDGPIYSSGSVTLIAAGAGHNILVNENVTGLTGVTLVADSKISGPGLLVALTNGVRLLAGVGGIGDSLPLLTSTGTLTLVVRGDATTDINVLNTGNLLLSMSNSQSINNLTVGTTLGSLTTSGAISAANVTLTAQSSDVSSNYSIMLGGTVGAGTATSTVTLSAGGSIVQSGTSSITANAITLNSENGNAGTSDNPLEVNVVADGSTPGNLSVVTQNGGAAYITNASNSVALENVSTAGDFSLSSPGDITVNAGSTAVNVSSTFGGVTLLLTGTGNISINGGVTAGGGPVVIENDDTTTGTIQVADDVTISGVGRIFDYQATPSIQSLSGVQLLSGPFPGSVTQGTISNDVNVFVSGSQVTSLPATAPTVYFGAGVTATATAVVNVSNGANVVFGTTDASSISLGSGVTINADAVVQAISSLDLSKSSVVSGMISLIQQGNAGVSGTLTATGGTVTFAPTVSLTNLSAFNVPAKFTVQFSNFDSNNPVVVNVPQSATANPVINGTVLFTGDGSFQSNGSLFINSNSSASKSVVLTMGSTGKLSSDNNLRMNVGGLVKIAGDLTYGAYNTFELFTGGANPGTSTAAPGTVTLSSTSSITTATAAANAQLTIRSGGSIVQSSGSQLTATNMLLAVGGINAGSSPASQIVANGVNAASLILIAGSGSSVSLLQGSKSSVSLVAVLAQHSTVSLSQAAALSLFGTTLGSLTASSSTGLTVVSDLGCGNCTFTTPSLAVNDAAVSTNRASGTVSISSSGALSVTGMNGSIFSSQQTSVKSGTARSITLSGIALTAETGNLSVTAGGALTIDGAILSAGALVDPFHLGVLLPSDLGSAGSIVISAKGITTTDTTVLQTSGGSISMTSTSSLVLNGQYSAQGGNIVVLARSSVSGTNPQLLANAIGTISTNSKGGGIEVGSGLTTSTKLSAAMLLAPGTVPRSPVFLQPNGTTQILGNNTSFENTNLQSIHTGVVQLNGTGVVNLSHSGNLAATVTLNGGAIVLDAVSSTSSVKLDGSTFSTNSYQPIAFHQPMPPLEELYTADDNTVIRTRFAEIRVRKGSVMTISSHDGLVRITSLSGSLSVLAGGRSMEVHNGEELIVSDHRLTLEEQTRSDGVGRRNFQTFPLAAGLHATVCDVSLVSLIRESQLLDSLRHPQTRSQKALAAKVLRNAAALHVVTQGRGAYQSRSKELRSGNGSENLTPVRYVR